MEQHEIILYPEPAPTTSREEVAGGIGLCLGFIAEGTRQKARELKGEDNGTQNDVKRALKKLIMRSEVLANGIDASVEPDRLAAFIAYLKIHTTVMDESLPIAKDNGMLADMVDRFGLGIQTNMSVNGLLSKDAIKELKKFKEDD